jgi:hypothetical protein
VPCLSLMTFSFRPWWDAPFDGSSNGAAGNRHGRFPVFPFDVRADDCFGSLHPQPEEAR